MAAYRAVVEEFAHLVDRGRSRPNCENLWHARAASASAGRLGAGGGPWPGGQLSCKRNVYVMVGVKVSLGGEGA